MHVGVVGPVGMDRFAENVTDALQVMGHAVTVLGSAYVHYRSPTVTRLAMVGRQAFPRFDERSQLRVARTALDVGCEVVINLDARLMPGAVSLLRRNGIRVALWFPDAMVNMGRQFMLLAPYDALFFKEPYLVKRIRDNLDLPAYYMPEACNPRWHRPCVPAGTDPYLVVAGNMYASRVRLLERLIAKGIPLKLYGGAIPRWLGHSPVRDVHTGRSIYSEEKARIYRSAVGVLNNLHPAEVDGVNARLFEAAGSGAAVLTEFRPTLPDLFEQGEELLVFEDFDHLLSQATRLLNESGLTARLGDAAASRAHRDHTYNLRLTSILEKVT